MNRSYTARSRSLVTLLLSAFFAFLLLSSCAHSEKHSDDSPADTDRNVSSVFLFEREPVVLMPEKVTAPKKRADFTAATQSQSTPTRLTTEAPARDIASVPPEAPLAQSEHQWLPWMTIALGILLAFALAASVRSIKKSPRS